MNSASLPCHVCLKYRGESVLHSAEGSPAAKNVKCRRCHCRGHFASDCKEGYAHWERPTCLEELIPADVRIRYGIRIGTCPPLTFEKPRGAETLHELEGDEINTIVLPAPSDKDFYNKMGEVMSLYGIQIQVADDKKAKDPAKKITKEPMEARRKAIQDWCVAHGRHLKYVSVPAE